MNQSHTQSPSIKMGFGYSNILHVIIGRLPCQPRSKKTQQIGAIMNYRKQETRVVVVSNIGSFDS